MPPPPSAVSPIFSSNPSTSSFSSSDPSAEGDKVAPPPEHIITQSNVATRRLWVGLKYFRNEPVLHKMRLVSKPTRRMWMGVEQLEGICRGDRTGYVKGMRGVGESMYVSTDRGIMEIRECVERRTGGMLLCRVNPVY